MLAWFGELNTRERRTMGACFGGWALDAFDVQMYSFVIPTVIALWGLSRGEAGLIGTVTLLISSLGGWFSGTLADRFGRVRMLQTRQRDCLDRDDITSLNQCVTR
jgi:MFS family permease